MADIRVKTIRIKTGVVKRLTKDLVVYVKEVELQRERIQTFKDTGKDEHNIRKQEEVLQESLMMVPECQRRLVKAFVELKSILETEVDLKEHGEYVAAQKVLQDSKEHLGEGVC